MFKSKSLYGLIFFLMIVMVMGIYGCIGGDDDEAETYTVTFTFTNTGNNGKTIFGKLVTTSDTDCTSAALYFGTGVISSDTATIVLTDVAAGSYKGCGFVDVDSSSDTSDSTSLPNTGDVAGDTSDGDIVVSGNQTETVNVTSWNPQP